MEVSTTSAAMNKMQKNLDDEMRSELAVYIKSKDKFPVDFDKAWQWIGYSRKDNAKTVLCKRFSKGKDYQSCELRTAVGGTNREQIMLTRKCFQHFCMIANTEQAEKVRQIYIDIKDKHLALRDAVVSGKVQLTTSDTNTEEMRRKQKLENDRLELENEKLAFENKQMRDKSLLSYNKDILDIISKYEPIDARGEIMKNDQIQSMNSLIYRCAVNATSTLLPTSDEKMIEYPVKKEITFQSVAKDMADLNISSAQLQSYASVIGRKVANLP